MPLNRRPHTKISFQAITTFDRKRKGKREYLNGSETGLMMKGLQEFFESKVEVPRIRVGKTQTIDRSKKETLLLAKFLRDEKTTWIPRIPLY